MFIRFKTKHGELKINLDLVQTVFKSDGKDGKAPFVSINFNDGSNTVYTEGVTIDDAEAVYSKFPC